MGKGGGCVGGRWPQGQGRKCNCGLEDVAALQQVNLRGGVEGQGGERRVHKQGMRCVRGFEPWCASLRHMLSSRTARSATAQP